MIFAGIIDVRVAEEAGLLQRMFSGDSSSRQRQHQQGLTLVLPACYAPPRQLQVCIYNNSIHGALRRSSKALPVRPASMRAAVLFAHEDIRYNIHRCDLCS